MGLGASVTKQWRLIADVGGTNARLARSFTPGEYTDMVSFDVAAHATFEEVLTLYLERFDPRGCLDARIAAAGPLENDAIKLTNAPWTLSAQGFARMLNGKSISLCNDLEAVARLLPHVSDDDLALVSDIEWRHAQGPRLAINIGTGFGAAFASPRRDGSWWFGATEAGHMRLPMLPASDAPMLLAAQYIEDILSGHGVQRLAAQFAMLHGGMRVAGANPLESMDEPARRALVMLLSRVIGEVTGDLVLATGAWGGVYFCGSVAQAWHGALGQVAGAGPLFRSSFADKGKMRDRLSKVPLAMIRTPDPGLMGLTYGEDPA